MKHISFQFNYCCVCNEKTFIKELTICSILDLNKKLKNMKNLLKMNPKHHLLNYDKIILKELLLDTIHVHSKLDGLLLAKKGISNIEPKNFISTTCYIFIKINKMPKLTLANGLWIGIAPKMLPKLTMVEETLITRYHCRTILFKLRYTNKGSITGQHTLKGKVISFVKNSKHATELLGEFPLSLESLSNFVIVHFVGSTHPKVVKSCKFLYVCKYVITL